MSSATIYCGDWRDVLPAPRPEDIHAFDPPYGINYAVRERAYVGHGNGLRDTAYTATAARAPIAGDDQPFDPASWRDLPRVAIFGANYFADCLPTNRQWVVWDKRRDTTPDDHSDAELIWLSVKGPARIFRHLWRGVVREGEENCSRSKKLHPNQKPVALCTFLLRQLGAAPGDVVVDAYMGSGSMGVAALRLGCGYLGAEIDPGYFATARARLVEEGFVHVCGSVEEAVG